MNREELEIAVAKELVRDRTMGLCGYGKVCEDCDCFADYDGGKSRDSLALRDVRSVLNTLDKLEGKHEDQDH